MRITTWNCCRGSFDEKFHAVVEREQPTILALQEVARPESEELCRNLGYTIRWNGSNDRQGYALAATEGFAISDPVASTDGARGFVVGDGDRTLHVLVVWAQAEPQYPENVWRNLDFYREFLKAEPSVVLGDFNSAPCFDSRNRRKHHELVERLRDEFGLFSVYHEFHHCQHGEELHPTHYWTWKREKSFHLDYIFLPNPWRPLLRNISVGGFDEWQALSDHRPVTVEIQKTYPDPKSSRL